MSVSDKVSYSALIFFFSILENENDLDRSQGAADLRASSLTSGGERKQSVVGSRCRKWAGDRELGRHGRDEQTCATWDARAQKGY